MDHQWSDGRPWSAWFPRAVTELPTDFWSRRSAVGPAAPHPPHACRGTAHSAPRGHSGETTPAAAPRRAGTRAGTASASSVAGVKTPQAGRRLDGNHAITEGGIGDPTARQAHEPFPGGGTRSRLGPPRSLRTAGTGAGLPTACSHQQVRFVDG